MFDGRVCLFAPDHADFKAALSFLTKDVQVISQVLLAALAAWACLVLNAGWVNPTILTFLQNESASELQRKVQRHFFFDFAGRKGFEHQDWHQWALTVRRRLMRLLGKMIRARSYSVVASKKTTKMSVLAASVGDGLHRASQPKQHSVALHSRAKRSSSGRALDAPDAAALLSSEPCFKRRSIKLGE